MAREGLFRSSGLGEPYRVPICGPEALFLVASLAQ